MMITEEDIAVPLRMYVQDGWLGLAGPRCCPVVYLSDGRMVYQLLSCGPVVLVGGQVDNLTRSIPVLACTGRRAGHHVSSDRPTRNYPRPSYACGTAEA